MRLSQLFTIFVVLTACGAASAETRSRLFSSGTWTLDRVDGFTVKDGKFVGAFDDMCVAESSGGKEKLSFAMNASDSPIPEEYKRNIYLQLSSPAWNYPFHEDNLFFFSVGVFGAGNAWYFGDTVAYTLPNGGYPELAEFVKDAGGDTTAIGPDGKTEQTEGYMIAIDPEGRIIARIDTHGLKTIYEKMLDCAGLGIAELSKIGGNEVN